MKEGRKPLKSEEGEAGPEGNKKTLIVGPGTFGSPNNNSGGYELRREWSISGGQKLH